MRPRTAVIVLIVMAIFIAVVFGFSYYKHQSLPQYSEKGEDSSGLTPEAKKQEIIEDLKITTNETEEEKEAKKQEILKLLK